MVRYSLWITASLLASAVAVLVLPDVPPKGFNSFDSYSNINHSATLEVADAMQQQLLVFGYEMLVLDGGWSTDKGDHGNQIQHLDQYGRPIPSAARFPQGMKALAKEVHSKGLKFGLWNIRGVHIDAVNKSLQIKGTNYTFDSPGFVDVLPVGGGANGSCLWANEWLGVNKSHPAAQQYYDSRVELFADWDVDFLKADCMMCGPCYTDEMEMFTRAVKESESHFTLSYSPGGGNEPTDGEWVAANQIGTMYRIVTDFHGGWYGWGGLQQAIFIAGNFTAAGLNGKNGTYTDNDMLPLSAQWWTKEGAAAAGNHNWTPEQAARGQTIITLDIISRSPLMHAGTLPADPITLAYETNKVALDIHANGRPRVVGYQGNCTCSGGPGGSCTIPHPDTPASQETATLTTTAADAPCMAVWASSVKGSAGIGDGEGVGNVDSASKASYTAVAVFNMGEADGIATVTLADLGLENTVGQHAPQYPLHLGSYVRRDYGTSCLTGTELISMADCDAAATALELKATTVRRTLNQTNYPSGCILLYNEIGYSLYFNVGKDGVNNPLFAPICLGRTSSAAAAVAAVPSTVNVWTGAAVPGQWPLKVNVASHGSVLLKVGAGSGGEVAVNVL